MRSEQIKQIENSNRRTKSKHETEHEKEHEKK